MWEIIEPVTKYLLCCLRCRVFCPIVLIGRQKRQEPFCMESRLW